MKSIINILLMGATFLCSSVFAGADPDSFNLQIEGKILNAGLNAMKGCRIELLCDNVRVDSFVLENPKRKFSFSLNKNRHYTIRITQEGYIDKMVAINTAIPLDFEDAYGFFFETSLIDEKELSKLNKEVLFLPVARIFFDSKRKCFYYDKAYSETIKKEMLAHVK